MKFLIHLIAESEVGQQVQEIACLERKEHRLEDVGLTLREAKKLLGAIQQRMVEQQVEEYLETQRSCPHCGRVRGVKGSHTVMFQTLFGDLELCSPRWNHCGCRANPAKTFSPLLGLLDDHVSPERLYLETKWASLISFELAAQLLKDTLPVAETVNAAGVRNHLHRVAERLLVFPLPHIATVNADCQRRLGARQCCPLPGAAFNETHPLIAQGCFCSRTSK
jgi:hypothetical protein